MQQKIIHHKELKQLKNVKNSESIVIFDTFKDMFVNDQNVNDRHILITDLNNTDNLMIYDEHDNEFKYSEEKNDEDEEKKNLDNYEEDEKNDEDE